MTGHPVLSQHGTVEFGEHTLDVVCSFFGDRVFLLVTQFSKVGTLLEISRDSLQAHSSYTYTVKTLLGKDEPDIHVFGRAIASSLSLPAGVSLLLGLGLHHHTPAVLNHLLPQLQQFRTWNTTQPPSAS